MFELGTDIPVKDPGIFRPFGADKQKGFILLWEALYRFYLTFVIHKSISKYCQTIETPCLSYLNMLDVRSLMGGVLQCISFQSSVDSLKKKS